MTEQTRKMLVAVLVVIGGLILIFSETLLWALVSIGVFVAALVVLVAGKAFDRGP